MSDPVICKTVGTVTKGADDESVDNGTFEVILSTPTADRDGEEVKAEEWKTPLPDHITFDIDHGMSVATTVGSGTPEIDADGKMVVKGRWASTPLAQQTRALVNEGHIKTTSVAFLRLPGDAKAHGGASRELLNGAFVAVPANAEALVLNSKSLQDQLERQAQADAEVKSAEAVLKALAGSYEERERAVYDAVSRDFTDYDSDVYAWPVATFDDAVVFRISGGDESGTTWRAPYTMADDGTATLGQREQVVITEVITTVPEGSKSASKAADPAAQAAGSAADDAGERALDAEYAAKAAVRGNLLAVQFGR